MDLRVEVYIVTYGPTCWSIYCQVWTYVLKYISSGMDLYKCIYRLVWTYVLNYISSGTDPCTCLHTGSTVVLYVWGTQCLLIHIRTLRDHDFETMNSRQLVAFKTWRTQWSPTIMLCVSVSRTTAGYADLFWNQLSMRFL